MTGRLILSLAASSVFQFALLAEATSTLGLTLVDVTSPEGAVTTTIDPSKFSVANSGLENTFADTAATRVCVNQKTGDFIYRFEEARKVNAYAIFNYKDSNPDVRAPKAWTFEASNDGEVWTVLDTQSEETGWKANEMRFYLTANTESYTYYKLDVSANNGNQYLQFNRLEYYDVDLDSVEPVVLGASSFTCEYSSFTVSQSYEIRPEATIESVTLWLGESEDSLTATEIPVTCADGVATAIVDGLSSGEERYWKLQFSVDYREQTRICESPVMVAKTISVAIWKGGTGAWMSDDWNITGYPNDSSVEVRIDGGKSDSSVVSLTLTSDTTSLGVGKVSVDAHDQLTTSKNFGGSATASFAGLENDGTVNVNSHASGNSQGFTLKSVGPFVNNGTINVSGSGHGRNRISVTLSVDSDRYLNNGTIVVSENASDRNTATFQILSNGEFVNNGLIELKLLTAYSGGSGSTYARINLGDSTANGVMTFSGSGTLHMPELERTEALGHRPTFTGGAYSTVVTNGVNHTIRGAGNIDRFSLSNDGLVLAEGDNLSLSVQNTYMDLGGVAMYNNASGRMVAKGAAGMYIGGDTAKNSRFLNYGLLEARTGSFIGFRTGVTDQSNKGTIATTVAMKQAGTWAGGGTFRMPRPLQFMEGVILKPGDLANETDEQGNVIYGKGESTPGQLTFTNKITLDATTVTEFQCRKPEAGKYDSVWVNGDATVAGTFRFLEQPHGGTYPIFTSTGTLTCDLSALKIELADGVHAPKLRLNTEATYSVEEPVLDETSGEPVLDEETGLPKTQTVDYPCQRIEATWNVGFSLFIR